MLFSSLGCNLFAALASVLALQWIREYDTGLSSITIPKNKALLRHHRYQGARRWFLPQIISFLPIFLHIALLLFVGGLCVWLFNVNRTVAVTMIATLVISAFLYVGTQAIAAIDPTAPFRTPISKFVGFVGETLRGKLNTLRTIFLDWGEDKCGDISPLKTTDEGIPIGRYAREMSTISQDQTIPSSALIWLLNHIDLSNQSVMPIYEVFNQLTTEELFSTLSQPNLKDQTMWATLLSHVAQEILPDIRETFQADPWNESALVRGRVIYGLSAIVGPNTMQGWFYTQSTINPFMSPLYQGYPFGLANRFALYRAGRPYRIDNQSPPTELLQSLCRTRKWHDYATMASCIRELIILTLNQKISRDFSLECLTLCFSETLIFHRNADIRQASEIWSLYLSLALAIFGHHSAEEKTGYSIKDDEKAIESILDLYQSETSRSRFESSQDIQKKFLHYLAYQIMAALMFPRETDDILTSLRLLRHPALFSMWLDPNVTLPLAKIDFESLPYARLYSESNNPNPSFPAALELTFMVYRIAGYAKLNLNKDWNALLTSLSTIAICLLGKESHNLVFDFDHPDLVVKYPVPWVTSFLQSLKPIMVTGTRLSLFVMDQLSGPVRVVLDTRIHCTPTMEGLEELKSLHDPILITVGCMLLGWDYSPYFPSHLPQAWTTDIWKIIYGNWYGYGPHLCVSGDIPTAGFLAAQPDTSWHETLISGLSSRLRTMVGLFSLSELDIN
jgi:hypothetical protein